MRNTSIIDRWIHARTLQVQWESAPNAAEKTDRVVTDFIRNCDELSATARKCLTEALECIMESLRLDKFDEGILPFILDGLAIRNLCRLAKSYKASRKMPFLTFE